jgi:hypothetical protein
MRIIFLLFSLLIVLPAMAQVRKQAWTYTLDERIALRTDVERARERVRTAGAVRTGGRIRTTGVPALGPEVDAFDGRSHPELFLPHEVFREFMRLTTQTNATKQRLIREALTPDVRRVGLPDDFFERLGAVTAVYAAKSAAEHEIGQGLHLLEGAAMTRAKAQLAIQQADVCRSRAEALDAARREFGAERFDRLLYEVMAVNMFTIADRLPDARLLRRAERGCR